MQLFGDKLFPWLPCLAACINAFGIMLVDLSFDGPVLASYILEQGLTDERVLEKAFHYYKVVPVSPPLVSVVLASIVLITYTQFYHVYLNRVGVQHIDMFNLVAWLTGLAIYGYVGIVHYKAIELAETMHEVKDSFLTIALCRLPIMAICFSMCVLQVLARIRVGEMSSVTKASKSP